MSSAGLYCDSGAVDVAVMLAKVCISASRPVERRKASKPLRPPSVFFYTVGLEKRMEEPGSAPVTMLLQNWRRGDRSAFDQVAEIVDRELRRLAASYLRRERSGHTLQPTALVNEAFMRLVGLHRVPWESRGRIFGMAAHMMCG